MADHAAEIPTQPEQKRPSVVDRVKASLGRIWKRVGPESVITDKMTTFQAVREAVGPGKAEKVLTLIEPVYKAGAVMAGLGVMAEEIALGEVTGFLAQKLITKIPFMKDSARIVENGHMDFGQKKYSIGQITRVGINKTLGQVAAAEVITFGVAHKMAGGLEKHVIRPVGVGIAEIVGRITRGWDTPPVEVKPVSAP